MAMLWSLTTLRKVQRGFSESSESQKEKEHLTLFSPAEKNMAVFWSWFWIPILIVIALLVGIGCFLFHWKQRQTLRRRPVQTAILIEPEQALMTLTHGPPAGEGEEGEQRDPSLWGTLDALRFRTGVGPRSYYKAHVAPLPVILGVQRHTIITRKPVPRPLPPLPGASKPRPLPPIPGSSTVKPPMPVATTEGPDDEIQSTVEPPAPHWLHKQKEASKGKSKGKGKE